MRRGSAATSQYAGHLTAAEVARRSSGAAPSPS